MQHSIGRLTLTLFGAFQVVCDGVTITQFRGDKVRALLVYLAVECDRPHSRAHLAGLLWPEQRDAAALANVSKSLVRLRTALSDTDATPLLLGTRQTIQWNAPGGADVDVTAFLRLARSTDPAALEQAAALYRGPLLPGFSIPGCPAFDEWLLLTREHCEHRALAALDTLAGTYLAGGTYSQAESAARRVLALDSWREEAHRQLMHALAGKGDRAAALAAYERCRQVLHTDLQVEPDGETRALAEQIRAGVLGPGAAQRAATPPGSPTVVASAAGAGSGRTSIGHDWSEAPDTGELYGRTAEAAQLEHWLLHERCRLVAVLGMGGVGKTVLAALVARAVAGHFERVLWRSLLNAPPLEDLLCPVLQALAGPAPAELPAGLDAQLAQLLDGLRRHRCLLILDNLESLLQGDGQGRMRPGYEGYGVLLERLAHSQHNSCLVLTSRERPQGLARWEADLPAVRALRLEGLDPAAGAAIVAARGLTGQADDARALVERYSGHPLALKLVAQTVHELFGGTIGDFLREETPIFDDIRTVLDQQFARLTALEQELLTWLAIEREAATAAVLRGNLVQQPPAHKFLEALRALQRRSLLERVGDGFTLQNVVIEYLTERLIVGMCAELLHANPAPERPGDGEQRTLPDSFAMLNSLALVKAQAKEYVRESQTRMILRPVVERLLAELGTAGVAVRVQAILDRLRERAPRAPGYAGGNLLNLLLQAGIDVAGYDFSRLSVWQADLQGVVAAGADFGAADLTGSTFTQIMYPVAVTFGAADQLLVAGSTDNDVCLWRSAPGQPRLAFRTPGQGAHPLVFSPDAQLLAGVCRNHTLRLWSVATGATLRTLQGHTGYAVSVAFSHDAQLVASSSADQTIRLWDVRSGRCLRILRHPLLRLSCLAFRPPPTDGSQGRTPLLVSGGDAQALCLWDIERGRVVEVLDGHQRRVECLAFSGDGNLLASGSHDGTILLWDVHRSGHGRLLGMLRGHSHIVRDLVFHPDCHQLASGSADGTVRIWDIHSGQTRQLFFGGCSEMTRLAFDPDGRVLAGVNKDQVVRRWEVETGRGLDTHTGYMSAVLAVRFRPDGRQLVSGSGDGRIHLWERSRGRLAGALQGHAAQVTAVAYSPDGRLLASGSRDATIQLWDPAGGRSLRTLREHQGAVKALAFSPDGRLLASAGVDRAIRLWSVTTGAVPGVEHYVRVLNGHAEDVESVAFSPDGRLLLSSSLDRTARLWSVERGQAVRVLRGHTAPLAAAAVSPRGDRIATTSYDGTVRLWEVATGRCCDGWENISAGGRVVAFSPCGRLLAYGIDHLSLAVRDVCTGTMLHTLHGHSQTIYGLDWSPSEAILASSSWDGTIRLWDADTGACVQTLAPPGPYAGMNIAGATGLSDTQRAALQVLGAVEAMPRPARLAVRHVA